MNSIIKEFNKSGLILDKTTQSLTALPYDYINVKFKSNSYVTSKNFNEAIDKLYYNLMYIYRGCKVGSFNLFQTYFYTISTNKISPNYSGIQNNYEPTTISLEELSASKVGHILPYDIVRRGTYLFFASGGLMTCLFTSRDINKLIFSTSNIDPLSGDIKFRNISDIKSDYYENLYVVDSEYNNIYQYRIDNFISRENIYRERLFIKNLIGGQGESKDNNKFFKLKNVAVNKNYVVAQDVGNQSFKIFDKNLNWKSTNVFKKLFDKYEYFDDILLDDANNLICAKSNIIILLKYDNGFFRTYSENKITQYLQSDEYIKQLILSPSDKNVIYIVTNLTVKKAWTTNLNYVIGSFNYNSQSNINVKWMSVSPGGNNNDIVALYSHIGDKEQLSVSFDSINYSSLFNVEDFNIYTKDEVKLNKDEYVQSWTIIKNLQKIYYNCLIVIQNIKYKFIEKEGINYPVISDKLYNTSFLAYSSPIEFEKDFDIGINEIFQAEVINRCIKILVELQSVILIYIINNKNNKKYYSPEPEKSGLPVKKYLYFADESLILIPNPAKLDIFQEITPGAGILNSLGGAPYSGIEGISITDGVVI